MSHHLPDGSTNVIGPGNASRACLTTGEMSIRAPSYFHPDMKPPERPGNQKWSLNRAQLQLFGCAIRHIAAGVPSLPAAPFGRNAPHRKQGTRASLDRYLPEFTEGF